jgi:hypothetical protein
MQIRLQPVLKILAALIAAVSVGLLARQTTLPHDSAAHAPCTTASLDAIVDGGDLTLSAGCTLRLRTTRTITGDVTIHGNDSTLISSGQRLFIVDENASLLLTGVTLKGVHDTASEIQGGALLNAGRLELRGSQIERNILRHGDGAAIYNLPDARLVLLNVLIRNNRTGDGVAGGIYNAGNIYIHGGRIQSNEATSAGGFYNAEGATATLTQVVVTDNQARYSGGIESAGALRMIAGEITENRAIAHSGYGGYGAGLTNRGRATIEDALISQNSGTGEGIGIDSSGILTIHNSIIAGNQCSGSDCRGTGLLRYDGTVSAQHNYWGAASGPGDEGPGTGDGVANLPENAYTPWLDDVPEWAR